MATFPTQLPLFDGLFQTCYVNRRAMPLSSGVRHAGVSLVIATGSFPSTLAVTAALVFTVFQTIVLALAAAAWGRLSQDDTGAGEEAGGMTESDHLPARRDNASTWLRWS